MWPKRKQRLKMGESNIIKLNLVMTYPVQWSLRHIMEDYIQNFYDVLGPEDFSKKFHYNYNKSTHTLRLESQKGFNVEWLKYIGVSTKRDGDKAHHTAGKFGEGFKIASLCAYRDRKLSIHMESSDWMLDVVKTSGSIDGQSVEFLAYDIKRRKRADNSILLLGNVNSDDYNIFLTAMRSFFYSGNPVLGDCIVNMRDYAVYKINPSGVPENSRTDGKVFASMQERAGIRYVPLVFCNHTYEPDEEDDRDRMNFSSSDTEDAVTEIVSRLEGEALKEVFIAFQPYWCNPGNTVKHGPDWGRLMRKMVWKIAEDSVLLQEICGFLKEKYIADIDSYVIKHDRNRYKTAIAWFRASKFHGTRKILPYYFSDLKIDTLYTLCGEHGGFDVIREPDKRQRELIRVLENMASDVFADFLCYEKLPECKVIVNEETPNEGFVKVKEKGMSARNVLGLKAVNDISVINLRKGLFCRDAFPQAMSVYMHELLHQFGADASRHFRIAILAMDYRIMEMSGELERYEKEWKEVWCEFAC